MLKGLALCEARTKIQSICTFLSSFSRERFPSAVQRPCFDLSESFAEYLVNLKAAKMKTKFDYSKDPRGMPSTGLMATMAALQLCESVDLYGFSMCDHRQDQAPEDAGMVHTDVTKMEEIDRHFVEHEQGPHKYYCHYYMRKVAGNGSLHNRTTATPVNAWRNITGYNFTMEDKHIVAVEHAMLRQLAACGAIRIWG